MAKLDDVASLRTAIAGLGLVLLVGPALPLGAGLGPAVLGLVGALVLAIYRGQAIAGWLRGRPLDEVVRGFSLSQRAALCGLVILPAVVFTTVIARAVVGLTVAFPAALWAVPIVLLAGVAMRPGAGTRVLVPVAVGLALLCGAAGVFGTRYEAAGADARGWAHSGPLHGIHPFQTTAIIVDGHGPYDIPINDYVEPDGSRGYGPPQFADALERALDRIAELHFADGPAQARIAFSEAEVASTMLPGVRERLDREPNAAEQPRFVVYSGTFGQRSRVEFVCPGRRDDPRGHPGETIMNRMCPDKYASEASAGLGVTGRWPGYAEARGNERLGLSRALGWARSDDALGQSARRTEHMVGAFVVLGLLAVLVAPLRGRFTAGAIAPGLGVAILSVLWLSMWAASSPTPVHVPFIDAPGDSFGARGWLVLGLVAAPIFAPGKASFSRASAVAVVGLAATVLVAGTLSALHFASPELWLDIEAGREPMLGFVAGVADRLDGRLGLSVFEFEGLVASAFVALLLAAAIVVVRHGGALIVAAWPGDPDRSADARRRMLAVLILVGLAACMVISRKTEGASTLVHGAIGLLLVMQSAFMAQARVASGSPRLAIAAHLGWSALAFVLIVRSVSASVMSPFTLLCAGAGVVATIGGLILAMRPRQQPPESAA